MCWLMGPCVVSSPNGWGLIVQWNDRVMNHWYNANTQSDRHINALTSTRLVVSMLPECCQEIRVAENLSEIGNFYMV